MGKYRVIAISELLLNERGNQVILVNFEEKNPNVISLFKWILGILGQNFSSPPPEIITVRDIKLLIAGMTTKREGSVNKIISHNYLV